ncbi:hypothetical protein [Bacillus sp. FJAT-26390]|uniref:hypothetical protein n=1 Tax=Bacillus sp. FJAT-26390 TaxID=1743142 RepID=UPI000807B717|nr:hypothetical protein [Bacillus sp. FJAT-26390]OBZ16462.1 hypothetical protein A7975_00565 [Bacillus sp. FJAT-26390]
MKQILNLSFLCLALIVLLSACGHGNGELSGQQPSTIDPEITKKMSEPKLVQKDDLFEMKLNITKTTFKVGEPIVYSTSLTYIGEQKSFTIWGPETYIGFYLTDGKKLRMDGASTMELMSTKLIRGETLEFPFSKSGGYGSKDPDADFWKKFYSEKDLLLPPGTYLIAASCNFSLTQEVVDSHYKGEVYTTITVVE